ncbi:NADH dehydrogenase [ubiquinone] 1 alpha subcomplex assembly factor 2 [Colletes gigas]|uniref:NADH dehydrogenase [ubiquinone] 1 alpha subcomplex assembly factor 2 n=1 Tax=Colletes gigas TaxID=935657 RepID=UPI001C9B6FFA|nr:NADH dehydrogenase [ubiquinone] 1 alpha subcomplex assembly factor 2 [Colletes gigas]XP_043265861.1 NADH dehydrogenase [ubiquinone] 1 alpha subcomplex assembly factor 2 [Colletes gigas]
MTKPERGVIQIIWKSFVGSLRLKEPTAKLIGEDFYGTKYYERPHPTNTVKKRPSRYFEPVNKEAGFDQEIPAEWESWLRYRRMNPPTKEELEQNYRMAMTKKQNAAQIEAKFGNTNANLPELPANKKGQSSFPTYKEYEEEYKVKVKEDN